MIRTFNVIERMNVAKNTRVTFDDLQLIDADEKDTKMDNMHSILKDEGNRVMRTITKKVLGNFWRHYTTADAETQTYDKAIEVLKAAIKNLEKINKQQIERIGELEVQKSKLDTTLLNERADLIKVKRTMKEQEEELRLCKE